MKQHAIVPHDAWVEARIAHLQREKEFTRLRDQLSRDRRELPWERVEKPYVFDTAEGRKSLAELFGDCSQLIVYHFMYGPDWEEGCPSCSFWADNFDGIDIHLRHRDITLLAVSRAPLPVLDTYKRRMGWRFNWVSSYPSDFNVDFGVTFSPAEVESGTAHYNYRSAGFPAEEAPGISVFLRDEAGEVFHTYSCYARGLDMLNGAYHYMDLTPRGRDEDNLPYTMAWLHRRDQYPD